MRTGPPRVVIVEDEPVTANLYAMILEKAGYAVDVAGSSDEVIALLSRSNCDLVLLDLYFPGTGGWEGGWEILRRVRERTSAVELPVVILSTETDARVRSGMMELGANEYLTKPVAPAALIEAVERWVRSGDGATRSARRDT